MAAPPEARFLGNIPPRGAAATLARALLLASVAVPLVAFPLIEHPFTIPKAVVSRVILLGALLLLFHLLLSRGWRWDHREPLHRPLAVLLLAGAAAALLGYSPLRSVFSDFHRMWGVLTWLHLVLLFVLLRTFFGEEHWRRYFQALSLCGVLAAGAAATMTLAGVGTRWGGLAGNVGLLAAFLLFPLGASILLALSTERPRARLTYAVAGAVTFAALLAIPNRSAFLGLLLGLLVGSAVAAIVTTRAPHRRAALALVAAGLLLALSWLAPATRARWGQVVPAVERIAASSLAADERLPLWSLVPSLVRQRPLLGVGPENALPALHGAFPPALTHFYAGTPVDRVHNVILEFLLTSGVLGLLALLTLAAATVRSLARAHSGARITGGELAVLSGVFTAYGTYLLFWFGDWNSTPFLVALAAFVSWRDRGQPIIAFGDARGLDAGKRLLLGLGTVIVVAAAYQYAAAPVMAAAHTRKALASSTFEVRLEHHTRAVAPHLIGGTPLVHRYVEDLNAMAEEATLLRRDLYRLILVSRALREAEQALLVEISRDPRNDLLHGRLAELLRTRIVILGDTADFRPANAALDRARSHAPGRLDYLHLRAELLLGRSEGEAARDTLRHALQAFDGLGRTYLLLALSHLAEDDVDAAFAWALRGLDARYPPGDPADVRRVGERLEAEERLQQAADLYRTYLDVRTRGVEEVVLSPRDRELAVRLAAVQRQRGDTAAASATERRFELGQ